MNDIVSGILGSKNKSDGLQFSCHKASNKPKTTSYSPKILPVLKFINDSLFPVSAIKKTFSWTLLHIITFIVAIS